MRLILAAALVFFSVTAQAAVIDFEADSAGFKPNGFVSASGGGVIFSNTSGTDLRVLAAGSLTIGQGLFVLGPGAGRLRMDFSVAASELSLVFGGDIFSATSVGDSAWLELFDGATSVGLVSVEMNRNGAADQTISYAGAAFDNARFWFGNAIGSPSDLVEIVDNVTFNVATTTDTPEPASLALFGAGLLGLAGLRRRR